MGAFAERLKRLVAVRPRNDVAWRDAMGSLFWLVGTTEAEVQSSLPRLRMELAGCIMNDLAGQLNRAETRR